MNKKLVLALLLAVASGSSVVAMDSVKNAAQAVVNRVVDTGKAVANLADCGANVVFSDNSYVASKTSTKVARVARYALTAFVVNEIVKKEKVKSFLKKVTDPITSRCCKDKK
ncbi:MAG TPA: hypothetical protein VI521_02595 [Candidatus Babeliales bacterium]|nr:hypothetical protein [Candidatus Babeliales bacterium]